MDFLPEGVYLLVVALVVVFFYCHTAHGHFAKASNARFTIGKRTKGEPDRE